jgi:hypothetical protein
MPGGPIALRSVLRQIGEFGKMARFELGDNLAELPTSELHTSVALPAKIRMKLGQLAADGDQHAAHRHSAQCQPNRLCDCHNLPSKSHERSSESCL